MDENTKETSNKIIPIHKLTKEEYLQSIPFRLLQQEEFYEWGMEYEIYDPQGL